MADVPAPVRDEFEKWLDEYVKEWRRAQEEAYDAPEGPAPAPAAIP